MPVSLASFDAGEGGRRQLSRPVDCQLPGHGHATRLCKLSYTKSAPAANAENGSRILSHIKVHAGSAQSSNMQKVTFLYVSTGLEELGSGRCLWSGMPPPLYCVAKRPALARSVMSRAEKVAMLFPTNWSQLKARW